MNHLKYYIDFRQVTVIERTEDAEEAENDKTRFQMQDEGRLMKRLNKRKTSGTTESGQVTVTTYRQMQKRQRMPRQAFQHKTKID